MMYFLLLFIYIFVFDVYINVVDFVVCFFGDGCVLLYEIKKIIMKTQYLSRPTLQSKDYPPLHHHPSPT